METFDTLVENALKTKGITKTKLLEILGIKNPDHSPLINYYLKGSHVIKNKEDFKKIADNLGVDFTRLKTSYLNFLLMKKKSIPDYLFPDTALLDPKDGFLYSINSSLSEKAYSLSSLLINKYKYSGLEENINPERGPFGLLEGMTEDKLVEESEMCSHIEGENCFIVTPKKPHSLFNFYSAYVDDEIGLFGINAKSFFSPKEVSEEESENNEKNNTAPNDFLFLKERLEKIYGSPWDSDAKNFLTASEYMHYYWTCTEKNYSQMIASDLFSIELFYSKVGDNENCITLRYVFNNAIRKIEKEVEKEDNLL